MYFREKVEEVIIKRLTKKNKTDKEISDKEFNQTLENIGSLVNYFARERKIMGFTDDDLKSFMHLKIHQVLRRGQYNPKKSRFRFFVRVFNNLFNDINRCKNAYLKETDRDAIDDCQSLDPQA